ncbi:MAG: GNAT family N-acetyltransferase [Ferruginibacter sp.]
MITITRTDSQNQDFIKLVQQLDADLAQRDGDEHSFYAAFNKTDTIKHVVVVYDNDIPVSCGAIKEYNAGTMEIKRMYSLPAHRGKGLAAKVLTELEIWATELACNKCILETGKKQPEAIGLYKKCGYTIIANYGQYAAVANSICFEKLLG